MLINYKESTCNIEKAKTTALRHAREIKFQSPTPDDYEVQKTTKRLNKKQKATNSLRSKEH